MSGDVMKEFLVGLGFEIDEAGLQKFNSGLQAATIAVSAIAVASVAAAGMISKFVSGVADEFDAFGDLSDRVNTSAEDIMRFGYVAKLTGSSVEASNASIENLSRVAGEAALGLGRGAKAFADIGLSAKDQNGNLKDTTVLMGEISDKIKYMGRGEQMAVLNKLGIDQTMIQMMTQDISGLAAEFDALYKNAGVDANEAAKKSGDFNDSLDRLSMTMDAVRRTVGLKFMNQIKKGIDSLRKFIVENMPKIINAIQPIIGIALRIAETFFIVATRIGQAIGGVVGLFQRLNDATGGWAGYIMLAVAAWKTLNLAFLASPIGMIIALGAAIALLTEDFMTWKEGGKSLIDWESWSNEIELVSDLLTGFKNVLTSVFQTIFGAIDSVVSLLTGDFANAWRSAGSMLSSIVDIFSGGTAVSTPSPQAQVAMGGSQQTVSQKTDIIVQGGANPDATARAVAGQQSRVNADMARNMRGAAR